MKKRINKSNSGNLLTYRQILGKLPLKVKVKIMRNAKKDARNGVVLVDEDGSLSVPFIQKLIYELLSYSAELWTTVTNEVSFQKEKLDKYQVKFDKLLKQLIKLKYEKEQAVNAVRKQRLGNDNHVEDSTLNRRVALRVGQASANYDAQIKKIQDEIASLLDELTESEIEVEYNGTIRQGEIHQHYHNEVLAAKIALYLHYAQREDASLAEKLQTFDIPSKIEKIDYGNKSKNAFFLNHPDYNFVQKERIKDKDFLEYLTQDSVLFNYIDKVNEGSYDHV